MKGTDSSSYDPFVRGRFPVGVRTIQGLDAARNRRFPCEIWYPAAARHAGHDFASATQDTFTIPSGGASRSQLAVRNAVAAPGTYPLIAFSHSSGGNRQQSTFLCTHLCSHGYMVAALDHSEIVAAELSRKPEETEQQKTSRVAAWIANRVPDIRFLLDHLLDRAELDPEARPDPGRIGIVGHSFGGWTALAATEADPRIRTVVALAPGGSSRPRPGIIPATLTFAWGRDVPTLYLVAENDVFLPLEGMYELFERTPAAKQMVILRRADHMHFMDDVEQMHEAVRKMPFPEESSWIQQEMRPVAELCSAAEAHVFVRGVTQCHMDATLREHAAARSLLAGDIERALAKRGVEGIAYRGVSRQEHGSA